MLGNLCYAVACFKNAAYTNAGYDNDNAGYDLWNHLSS